MEKIYITKIGSKGEIFPPKELREHFGLTKDQNIIMKVYSDRIVIKKLESLEDILKHPPIAKISYHVLKNMKSEFE